MRCKKNKFVFAFLFFLLVTHLAFSAVADSAKKKEPWSRAKKATVLSACFPGLGQIYNKKYWKTPIVYAAMGGLGYSILSNNKNYQKYSKALSLRADGDSTTIDEFDPKYSEANLVTLKRAYRRYRDLSILGACLVYVVQIIDANVDGHLSTFDVDNISFNVSPWTSGSIASGKNFKGLSLSVKF